VFVGSFDQLSIDGACAGADEPDEVGRVDGTPAVLCCFDELERHCQAGSLGTRPLRDFRPVSHG
jgi:hypothetical protein